MSMIFVEVKGHGSYPIDRAATYEQLANQIGALRYVAARQGNLLRELSSKISAENEIEFIGIEHPDGEKIYQRSLIFLFIRAATTVFPGIDVKVSNSLSKGVYCEIRHEGRLLSYEEYEMIRARMKEYVERSVPIKSVKVSHETAHSIFISQGMEWKSDILKYRDASTIRLYELDGSFDYYYGYMVPNTSYLSVFDLVKYDEGVIIMHPTRFSPLEVPKFEESPKLAEVFTEMEDWLQILGISYVYNLNQLIERGGQKELIQIAEALQEKKIAYIADEITKLKKRVILIAGPSSSGKTTFANRLRIQLSVNGLNPITIGTDNYFVDREFTPRDEEGNFDFEALEAVDLEQFNLDLSRLLDGEEVELPSFNFHTGKREYKGDKLRIREDQPIIIEGIHGLNDRLTPKIFKKNKYKIYISALTQLNIDEHNRIPTTQARLLRRMVRDNAFRGHSAVRTISMWSSVRRGEEKYIFPFQEEADAVFNSALPYELAVLKKHAVPLLEQIGPEYPEYQEALLLRKFLGYFRSIDDDELVPRNSILKEFIGGSDFEVH
ncbi:MAG: nucleoside kinase [Bacillota bacterium]|nr:nucleoside kinase [Bacillota bacterium]